MNLSEKIRVETTAMPFILDTERRLYYVALFTVINNANNEAICIVGINDKDRVYFARKTSDLLPYMQNRLFLNQEDCTSAAWNLMHNKEVYRKVLSMIVESN
jgi:hypothetical protein